MTTGRAARRNPAGALSFCAFLRVNPNSQQLKIRPFRPLNFREFENNSHLAANTRGMSVQLPTYWSYRTYKPYKTYCATFTAPETAQNSPKTPRFTGQEHPFRPAIWPISHSNMAHIALRYGLYHPPIWPISQNRGLPFAKKEVKNRLSNSISSLSEVLNSMRLETVDGRRTIVLLKSRIRGFGISKHCD